MRDWLDQHRARGIAWDRRWALALHHGVQSPPLLALLLACSRGGDWWVWVLLVIPLVLVFGGAEGAQCAALLLGVGAVNLAIYYGVKRRTRRPRPFDGSLAESIRARAVASDRFSFPSGHALHATTFTVVLCAYWPSLGLFLVPFATGIATARVVLGLHYPSDVIAGVAIGVATSLLGLGLVA